MTYRVEFTSAAAREVGRLDRVPRKRVLDAVASLATEPRPAGVRKVAGTDSAWRIRVGDHRVIYEIDDGVVTVAVIRVAHRREVYR